MKSHLLAEKMQAKVSEKLETNQTVEPDSIRTSRTQFVFTAYPIASLNVNPEKMKNNSFNIRSIKIV